MNLKDRALRFYRERFGTTQYAGKTREVAVSWLPKEALRSMPPNIFIDGDEYEWWCTANTPWQEWGYYNASYASIYDVYRLVQFDALKEEEGKARESQLL